MMPRQLIGAFECSAAARRAASPTKVCPVLHGAVRQRQLLTHSSAPSCLDTRPLGQSFKGDAAARVAGGAAAGRGGRRRGAYSTSPCTKQYRRGPFWRHQRRRRPRRGRCKQRCRGQRDGCASALLLLLDPRRPRGGAHTARHGARTRRMCVFCVRVLAAAAALLVRAARLDLATVLWCARVRAPARQCRARALVLAQRPFSVHECGHVCVPRFCCVCVATAWCRDDRGVVAVLLTRWGGVPREWVCATAISRGYGGTDTCNSRKWVHGGGGGAGGGGRGRVSALEWFAVFRTLESAVYRRRGVFVCACVCVCVFGVFVRAPVCVFVCVCERACL